MAKEQIDCLKLNTRRTEGSQSHTCSLLGYFQAILYGIDRFSGLFRNIFNSILYIFIDILNSIFCLLYQLFDFFRQL